MLNREAVSRHVGNMTQHAVAEATILLSMANCADILSLHELGVPLKHGLGALSDLQAKLATAALMAILDGGPSSWLEPIALTNSSRVWVLGRAS